MTENASDLPAFEEQNPRQSGWYLLTGLILGLIIGLVVSLLILPQKYRTTDPSSLTEAAKATYRLTISQVFSATNNLERAKQRLALLDDEDTIYALGAQAQRALATGYGDDARSLALLASALSTELTPEESPTIPTITPTTNVIPTQTLPELTPIP
jgi:hypothetical protein